MGKYKRQRKTTYRTNNSTSIQTNTGKPGTLQYTIDGFKEAFLVLKDFFDTFKKLFSKKDKSTSTKEKLTDKVKKPFNKLGKRENNNEKTNKNNRNDMQQTGAMQAGRVNIGKRIIVNYDQFRHDCDMCKKNIGDTGKGTIQNVNLKNNSCEIATQGNIITMSIPDVIKTVSVNHSSWISNPSKLAQWRGWKEAELW